LSKRGNPYQKPDHFTKKAKEQGFPARSVFKLEEIDRRARILKSGQRVLDLGAAPGSWSMYVAQKIGERGQLLSIDLAPLPHNTPAIRSDRERLKQIFLSVLSNSVKYNRPSGMVIVSLTESSEGHWRVSVTDTALYSPAWSTNGSFDTYYAFQNTTGAALPRASRPADAICG